VISLSILRHQPMQPATARCLLKHAAQCGRGLNGADAERARPTPRRARNLLGMTRSSSATALRGNVRGRAVRAYISERGYGKRSSSYEYRITGRAEKASVAMDVREAGRHDQEKDRQADRLIPGRGRGSAHARQPMAGQLIRTPVEGIRIAGRSTQGVIVFDTAEGERVVSVERISEEGDENGG